MDIDNPTIYAPASGMGRAGVAIIRVSGPRADAALAAVAGCRPPPRRATVATLRDPASGEALDRGLVLRFPAPASFTGEDVAEFHVHGGRAVLADVLAAVGGCAGLRPAEPGEFTRRAFENGKLDLTAAEGLADLVNAETAAQRRQALRQLDGELGRLYETWRERLVGALAHVEAGIDFSDEDLPAGLEAGARTVVAGVMDEIADHLADDHRGERLRDGLSLAIVGPPNAGKSSLLNHLAQRDAAIVAETAGTTRDVIEVHLDLGGYPVIVADTAGLRQADEGVEAEGVRRARRRAELADLRLVVFDRQRPVDAATEDLVDHDALVVFNKMDLTGPPIPEAVKNRPVRSISVRTGEGVDGLIDDLRATVGERLAPGSGPALTRARHRRALESCRESLARSLEAGPTELAAEDLRLAVRALGRITGRVGVEDMLDVIFADFCIGK